MLILSLSKGEQNGPGKNRIFSQTIEKRTEHLTGTTCGKILCIGKNCFKVGKLTGKMGKKSFKKLVIALIILGGFIAVLSVLAIMFAMGVFG
jgi:hypothetical protein